VDGRKAAFKGLIEQSGLVRSPASALGGIQSRHPSPVYATQRRIIVCVWNLAPWPGNEPVRVRSAYAIHHVDVAMARRRTEGSREEPAC
jgi:hypothetical protein